MGVYIGGPITEILFDTQGPAPDGFHVPLTTERKAVRDIRTALGGGSSAGTNFGKALKLPFAGNRSFSSAGVRDQGIGGYYWSSSRCGANNSYDLVFGSTALDPQDDSYRASGFSVRCFKDTPVVPTSSWTKLYGTSIESGGIFWSSTDGLISLSSDGQTWITIQDKNLGATTVRNSGNTLSETNCGKYYQRGNNYGFSRTGSVTTSPTQVDASTYGPGNYYSSDTFIKYNGRWDTTDNGNLRGGVSQGTSTKTVYPELKNAYIGEVRTPGSNTLLYLPLESDTTDYSGNSVSTTPSNITYGTLGGVNCAIANGSSSIITFGEVLSSGLTEGTVSVLLYKNYEDTSSDDYKNILYYRVTNMGFVGIDSEYNGGGLNYRRIGGYVANRGSAYITSNLSYRWHHLLFTFNNSVAKYYIDGNKISEHASSTSRVWGYGEGTGWNTRSIFKGNPSANSYWKGGAREIIFEKKMWSDTEIINYFNKIKSQYGIS